jgi:SsrA-binding protein
MIANKRAYFDYTILEKYECGIVLEGWEVKAIANKQCSINGTYASVVNEQVFLIGSSIGSQPADITRSRKLLLHKHQIKKLIGKVAEKGCTLVPLKIYAKNGKFKLELGLANGKTQYDKRNSDKQKQREITAARSFMHKRN